MTCYRQRKVWRYDFWKNGIRHRQAGFRTKEEARIAEAEARKKIGKMNSDFISLCESRLKDLKRHRTEKYFRENERLIKKLIMRWGMKKEVTREDVEDYLDSLPGPFVSNKHLRLIKALFNHGIEREWFSYNPAGKVKFKAVSKKQKYIPIREDILKVLTQVNEEQRTYLLVLINTLARVSEINRLTWDDVHEDYLILKTRKSKNSNETGRKIPFNKTLSEIFKNRKEGLVFTYRGEQIGYRSKLLTTACKKAKVQRFTYHALRHYGASTLANANIPLTDIQIILGHQRTTTTDIYLQSIRGSVKEAMKKLEVL